MFNKYFSEKRRAQGKSQAGMQIALAHEQKSLQGCPEAEIPAWVGFKVANDQGREEDGKSGAQSSNQTGTEK